MGKDITIDDIFADLDKSFVKQDVFQEGDITIRMLMERYNLTREMAYKRFTSFSDDNYEKLKVNNNGAKTWVLRRK